VPLDQGAVTEYADSMAAKKNLIKQRPNGLHVITLRIDDKSKAKLHRLTLAWARETGKPPSYNAMLLKLIAEA